MFFSDLGWNSAEGQMGDFCEAAKILNFIEVSAHWITVVIFLSGGRYRMRKMILNFAFKH